MDPDRTATLLQSKAFAAVPKKSYELAKNMSNIQKLFDKKMNRCLVFSALFSHFCVATLVLIFSYQFDKKNLILTQD